MEKGVHIKELTQGNRQISSRTRTCSPCRRVCRVQAGVCVGCGRTLDQIAKWSKMTDEEKIQIMESLNSYKC